MKTVNVLVFVLVVVAFGLMNISYGSFADSPKQQLESGILPEDISCTDNHVLVFRTNGNVACVTERTAEKTGWKVITQIKNTISPENSIPYYGGSDNGEPSLGVVKAELSKLPLLNEVVTLTVTAQNVFSSSGSSEPSEEFLKIGLEDGWEFVNVTQQVNHEPLKDGTELLSIAEPFTVSPNEIQTLTVQIKPTKLGINYFSTGIDYFESVQFSLYVGEKETIPTAQYWEENPELAPWNKPEISIPPEEPEPAENAGLADEDIATEVTDEEFIEWLENESGYSEEEIEKIKEESKKKLPLSSDITTEAVGSFITVHGKITNDLSPFSESSNRNVYDVKVCVYDYNPSGTNDNYGCSTTNEYGSFTVGNVYNYDDDGTGLDLFLAISTNGLYSEVKDKSFHYYQVTTSLKNNVAGNTYFAFTPDSSGSLEQTKHHRAFWISDSIADGREYFKDNGINVDKVNVRWEHDEGSKAFGLANDGAVYYGGNTKRIYLDGFDTSRGRADDSPERWTQLHEWGHHLMNNEFNGWPSGCSGSHSIHLANTEGCAWKEGWGDIIPSFVDNVSEYDVKYRITYNFEEDYTKVGSTTYYYDDIISSQDVGHTVEGHVAGVLWDIKDPRSTASYDKRDRTNKDNQSLGVNEILSVFSKEDLTFEGFYKQWKSDYQSRNNVDDIMYLHYMGFLNAPPVLSHISDKSVNELSTLRFTAYATDPNGDTLRFSLSGAPSGARISSLGSFSWTPSESQVGSHTFTVRVSDGKVFDTQSIRVTVNNVNQPPVISSISNKSVNEKSTLQFTARASDADGDTLRFSLTQSPTGASISNSGSFRWTPTESQVGDHNITIRVTDGKLSDTESFRVTVNNVNKKPVATPHSTITVLQDSNTKFWLYGTDADGDTLSFSIINYPDDGTITLVIGQSDQSKKYKYTPDSGFSGSDLFSFRVNDGTANSASVNVSIIVNKETIPPVITVPTNQFFEATFVLTPLDSTDYGTATATDFYPVTINSNAPATFPLGPTTITWSATDSNGNTSSGTQIITILDTTSPTIIVPPPQTFEATAILTPLDSTDYGVSAAVDIFPVEIINNAPNAFGLGLTTIIYTAIDSSDNTNIATQLITVQDTTIPTIVLTGDVTQTIELGDTYTELGATASDNIDGDITNNIVINSSSLDLNTIGSYQITYDVSDSSNNAATQVIRTVNVIEAPLPEFPQYVSYKNDSDFGFAVDDDTVLFYTTDGGNTWNEPYAILDDFIPNADLILIFDEDLPSGKLSLFQPTNLESHIVYALFELIVPNPHPEGWDSDYGVIVTTDRIITAGERYISADEEIDFDYPAAP